MDKDKIHNYLVSIVENGSSLEDIKIEYDDVLSYLGKDVDSRPLLFGKLTQICRDNKERGEPLLSAIVVSKKTRMPGKGFFNKCMRIPNGPYPFPPEGPEDKELYEQELKRVFEYWHDSNNKPYSAISKQVDDASSVDHPGASIEMKIPSISRTIYDPSTKDFITSTPDSKALPNIKRWINDHNPVIYWYILRLDNPSDDTLLQWAVELYTHQALSITEVYIDGINHRFDLKKREHDPWSEKYVLSIPAQLGIPIVSKGTRRLFFKVDIDCKEGLMHEYGISGTFVAQGMDPVEIKEKMFQYSCKVGEFRQIFDNNPDEASHYAEKRLMGKYSLNSVQVFTNSFRMIHDLYGYCHFGSLDRDELLQKLHLLHASFENVPEIAGERISPLISDGIRELDIIVDKDKFAPRLIKLCDALVELLHIEVMGAEVKEVGVPPSEAIQLNAGGTVSNLINEQNDKCPACGNIISESNKSLICKECGTRFCTTCEEWFREERKRCQKPLCENCFTAEEECIAKEIQQKENEELEKKAHKEAVRKKREEEEPKRKEAEEFEKKAKEVNSIGMKFTLIPAGEFMMGSEDEYSEHSEQPVHKVKIKNPFYLGTYPVTQREWKAIMGDNPSRFRVDDLPVRRVSWDDVQDFIRKLNEKEGTGKYRLPSEAEWEYACRAGTATKYCFGDSESKLGDYAWYYDNSGGKPLPIGQKQPNPWGLYDMHGNVYEWVQDEWHENYDGAPDDGSAWESGSSSHRVLRGGGRNCFAGDCRSSSRMGGVPGERYGNFGFRLLQEI